MRRTGWLIPMLLVALAGSGDCPGLVAVGTVPISGSGAVREGVWNESLLQSQSAARYAGRPLLVLFFEDWCGYCEQAEAALTRPEVLAALKRFVLVKTTVEENREFARQHRVNFHHQAVMLDWSGGELARVTEFASAKDVPAAVAEAAAANDLLAGRKLLELTYFGKAAERFRLVLKLSRDKTKLDAATSALEAITERAKRQMDLIRRMIRADRRDEAIDALNAFVRDFQSSAKGAEKEDSPPNGNKEKGTVPFFLDEAQRLLSRLKTGRPVTLDDGAPVVVVPDPAAAATPEDRARKLLDRAMTLEWDENYLDALELYQRAAKDFPETPSGVEAAKRAKLIVEDPVTRVAMARQQRDRVCRRLLQMGEMYEASGRDDLARERYRALLAAYPDGDFAAEAKKRLAAIDKHAGSH